MDATTGTTPPPTTTPPPPEWTGPRQLRRRPDAGPIAGVCAGVAEYFGVDPVLVRIIAVVMALSGPGLLAYVLAWIFVPAERGPGGTDAAYSSHRGTQIFGLVVLALAASVLLGDWWSPGRRLALPLGLMALGGWLLLRRDREVDQVPPASWTSSGIRARTEPLRARPLGEATAPDPAGAVADGGVSTAGWPVAPPVTASEPNLAASRRRLVGAIVLGALLAWSGVAWLLGTSVPTALAVALVIVGAGIVMGGSRLLVLPALLIGGALGLAAVIDIPLTGPAGDQRWTPLGATEVSSPYQLSVGDGTLDLTAIDLPEGERLSVEASVGIGQLLVIVPANLALDIDTHIGLGESRVLDIHREGVGLSTDQFDETGATGGTLALQLRAGVGQIEVRRAAPAR